MKIQVRTYVSRPVQIHAIQWTGDNDLYDYLHGVSECKVYRETRNILRVHTNQGVAEARIGDYIIRGMGGEYYPCSEEVFEKKYRLTDAESARDGDMHPEIGSHQFQKNFGVGFTHHDSDAC